MSRFNPFVPMDQELYRKIKLFPVVDASAQPVPADQEREGYEHRLSG
jgi:hypothetical protein